MTPNIYGYTDYRKYLRDWFEARAGRPSVRGFAKKVGCAPSLLSSVMSGKRDLSGPLAEKVAVALGADKGEQAYFLWMVQFEQAATRAQKREALDQMMAARRFHSSARIEDAMYLVFSRWYYPAILELARVRDFRPDPDWISATLVPTVPRADVEEALRVLQGAGLLGAAEDGRLVPRHPSITTEHEVGRVHGPALANVHFWLLERAKAALEEFKPDERHFGTISMAIPESAVPELKRLVQTFEETVIGRMADLPNPTRVYQLSVQLFPLSKPTGS